MIISRSARLSITASRRSVFLTGKNRRKRSPSLCRAPGTLRISGAARGSVGSKVLTLSRPCRRVRQGCLFSNDDSVPGGIENVFVVTPACPEMLSPEEQSHVHPTNFRIAVDRLRVLDHP